MKIGIDVTTGGRGSGGVATYVRELVRHLLIIEGVEGDEYLLWQNAVRATEESDPLPAPLWGKSRAERRRLRIPRPWLSRLWSRTNLLPIETWTGPLDVFHAPHMLLPPLRRARGVLTVHDCTYLKFPRYFRHRRFARAEYEELLPASLRRAAIVVVDSQTTRADFLECFRFPEDRVRVVPLGVSREFFARADPPAGREPATTPGQARGAALPGEPFVLCVPGTLEPRKNLPTLLRAYSLFLEQSDRKMPLFLTATPEESEATFPDCSIPGATDPWVRFIGRVPLTQLIDLLQSCHLFVYPSLYEGFGLPVLEAMAAGAAVIGGNRGALPEIVGDAGILVDPESPEDLAHAMASLAADEDLRERLKARARERAATFTWDESARRMLAIYHEAAG